MPSYANRPARRYEPHARSRSDRRLRRHRMLRSRSPGQRAQRRSLIVVGGCALLVLGIFFNVQCNKMSLLAPIPTVATVHPVRGDLFVGTRQQRRLVRDKRDLLVGQVLETLEPDSLAIITYADMTRLDMSGSALLTVGDLAAFRARRPSPDESATAREPDKFVRLVRGALAADIQPQPPGHPAVIETPHAAVEALAGCKFALSVGRGSTHIDVRTGRLFARNKSTGGRKDLREGESAEIARDAAPAPAP